jgi:rod shape-determining protein MreB
VDDAGEGKHSCTFPKLAIHPLEMTDGGLAEIEERVFREVTLGAGASKVVVWTGHQLGDDEVRNKLRAS